MIRILKEVTLATITAMLVVSMSGLVDIARAASCSDTWYTTFVGVTYKYTDKLDNFTSYNGKTYAYAKASAAQEKITTGVNNGRASLYGMQAMIANTYPGASLAKVSDGSIQKMLSDVFGPLITAAGQSSIYIGEMNKNDGAGYINMDGSGPASYYNWQPGQPNPAPACKSADGVSGSDPYTIMLPDGSWKTACDGSSAPLFEFPGVFDCAVPYTGTGSTTGTPASNIATGPISTLKQCDTANYDNFGLYGNMTYAITKNPMTWANARDFAQSSGGKLAYIGNKGTNDFLTAQFGPLMTGSVNVTGSKVWLGMYDPASVASWCMPGTTPCPTMPSRFQWLFDVSSYSNWATGQPDNYCTADEISINIDKICYGENWVTMAADGTWSDEGDHGYAPITLKAVVQWKDQMSCTSTISPPPPPPPGGDLELATGDKMCTDSNKGDIKYCEKTDPPAPFASQQGCTSGYTLANGSCTATAPCPNNVCTVPTVPVCPVWATLDSNNMCVATDNLLCPLEKVLCSDIFEQPSCPNDFNGNIGIINQSRTPSPMCQVDANISCPGTGGYLANPDLCYKDAYKDCGTLGYTISPANNRCEMRPQCTPSNTYSDVENKCTSPSSTTTGYASPISTGVTTITKYEARGYVATSASDYKTTSAGILDVLKFDFSVSSGQVNLNSFCAWGGNGMASCEYPDWNHSRSRKIIVSEARSGNQLTVTASLNVPTYGPYYCTAGTGTYYASYYTGMYSMYNTCVTFTTSTGFPPVSTPHFTPAIRDQLGWTPVEAPTVVIADISEFLICPSGYIATQPLDASSCNQVLTLWGNATGITDCTTPAQYSCTKTITACPAGQTMNAQGSCDVANPTCPGGSFQDNGNVGDVCFMPYNPTCNDPAFAVQVPGQPDLCQSTAIHDCPSGYAWNGLPVAKCEAVPVCSRGIYQPSSNSCSTGSGNCPAGDYPCESLVSDTAINPATGTKYLYCSPNTCTVTTQSMIINDDTTTGATDVTNDGLTDQYGNCLSTLYLFPGKDMRCRKVDRNGQINSIAKIIAQIILCATGVGAALAGAMLAMTAAQVATTVIGQVVTAAINAAFTMISTIAIDAGTGQLGQGTAVACGMAALTAVISSATAYFNAPGTFTAGTSTTTTDPTTGLTTTVVNNSQTTLVNGVSTQSAGEMTQGMTLVSEAGDTAIYTTSSVVEYNAATGLPMSTNATMITIKTLADGSQVVLNQTVNATTSSFSALLQAQATQLADDWGPAIASGMLSNYSATHCCYPDRMNASCSPDEFQEAKMQHDKWCHVVGTYCASKFLGMCIVEKETSCCFNSLLARIFHEQGRPQLKTFNGWGSPRSPQCRGFLPEEFQNLDFAQMDLSEYVDKISSNVSAITGDITNYMESVQQDAGARVQQQMDQLRLQNPNALP